MKFTILERSTGEKEDERCLLNHIFEPEDSNITILRKFLLGENIVGFSIHIYHKSEAQYLFLNLATRNQFRVRRADVISQIRKKADCSDFNGFLIKRNSSDFQIVNMHAENSLTKIRFKMTLRFDDRALSSLQNIPEFNLITIGLFRNTNCINYIFKHFTVKSL